MGVGNEETTEKSDADYIIEKLVELEDIDTLRSIIDIATGRVDELVKQRAKPITKTGFRQIWLKAPEDAKNLINQINKSGGEANKDQLIVDNPDWSRMKVSGMIGAINRQARKMSFEDFLTSTDAKNELGTWTIKYTLNPKVLEYLKKE
ncbi:MAG: hypothetical protein ACLFVX_01645 [Archaeoglobaceae archaeon]